MFWLMLFGSTALIMLALIEPKFAQRQQRLERMSESRAKAARNIAQRAARAEPTADAEMPRWQAAHRPTLRPLIFFIATVVLISSLAMRFVVSRRGRRASGALGSRSSPPGEAVS